MDLTSIEHFAQAQLAKDTSGHDYWHVARVAALGQRLFKLDQPDATGNNRQLAAVLAACWLHDTIDEKLNDHIPVTLAQINALLTSVGFTATEQADILDTMQHMSYSKNLQHHYVLSAVGQYVQDADRLDALGAIGIARTFAYGGHAGHAIYDPDIPVVTLKSHDQYRQHPTTSVNHFYEKLLNLEKTMNTTAGKRLARARTQYMQDFLAEFHAEWAGLR
ncbi:HD domain protein [Agrilactobacillus composti DSM 18527 = JCM 14202]|uniref:HD domain protein n=1 Tax=Agrilactobacillus composti DSM 18527 = JCM 14202 TaxID=1423734 RepID=A0A0R1XK03_9LACO|nr:hypothetical protein [Agrilactobacillus composti]KRM30522.1 HD domain protein [Agrilactobacillus composti DSM 18527 = JCM 14202]